MRGKFQLSKWRIWHFIPSLASLLRHEKCMKSKERFRDYYFTDSANDAFACSVWLIKEFTRNIFCKKFFTPLSKFGRWTSILWDEVEGKEGEEGRMEDRKHWGKWEGSFSWIRWAGGWGIWEITREAQKIGTITRAAARFTTGCLRPDKVRENIPMKQELQFCHIWG